MDDNDAPIPISALEHYSYCPRQCALVLVDGSWSDNEHTVRGELGHRRADEPGVRAARGRDVARAVPLWSERLGLTGRADAVEQTPDGELIPVEYKIGVPHGDAAKVQVCAEALCLEEMTGRPVTRAAVWYAGLRRRHSVTLDAPLRSRTLEVIAEVRALRRHQRLPAAPNDERCRSCQLDHQCLPSLVGPAKPARQLLDEAFG